VAVGVQGHPGGVTRRVKAPKRLIVPRAHRNAPRLFNQYLVQIAADFEELLAVLHEDPTQDQHAAVFLVFAHLARERSKRNGELQAGQKIWKDLKVFVSEFKCPVGR
jgi:hypothetical protein